MSIVLKAKIAPTFAELCDLLDLSPARTSALIDRANDAGHSVRIVGDRAVHAPAAESIEPVTVAQTSSSGVIAIVGDVHLGSKYHTADYFLDFCDRAYRQGVRHFLQVGDLLDGNYKHGRFELTHHGFNDQVELAIKALPQWPDAQWHFVLGNHDETFEDSGLDVGRAMVNAFNEAGRHDLTYHGNRGGYVRFAKGKKRGLVVHLWHPRSGGAYAMSYNLQKKIEGYEVGKKPDLLAAGHWHQSAYIHTRGVHAISSGCWQGGGSSFSKSLKGSPSIGSWIVRYELTKGGTVRSLAPEWVGYFENETVRSIELT
jgi:UDP-2,3-diacylglucosamine pyrophosphatase LpxH